MDSLQRISQYERFPGGVVYPGHPTCIALLVMDKYPDLETALHRPEGNTYGNALSDNDIPGAGGNVHAALDLLGRVREAGVEPALTYGDEWWARCASGDNFGESQAAGLEQAERIKAEFRARAEAWVLGPATPS